MKSSEMDVGVRRYNDRSREHYMAYPNYFRHSVFPNAIPSQNFFERCYMPGNKFSPFMNMNHFNQAPYILNETYTKQINQKYSTFLENSKEIAKVNMEKEKVVMASIKDKTPMCLINEISRFNKIEQKYILTNEDGPAHKKVFFVSLLLGKETFSSSGQSIKKARHAAAVEALKNTSYSKPPNKSSRVALNAEANPSITPSVKLNSLAMKQGQAVSYEVVGGFKSKQPNSKNMLFNLPRGQTPAFIVKVTVGGKEFLGDGYSVKSARHSAAVEALSSLKEETNLIQSSDGSTIISEGAITSSSANEDRIKSFKSEVSRVHEVASKRGFTVTFQITAETGPAHMRSYTTTCTCGPLMVAGEGNSKKTSKQRSAEKMLEELHKLSPLPEPETNKPQNKLRTKTDHSKQTYRTSCLKHFPLLKASPDYGAGINPVSRLIQIQQAKKQPEPSFLLLEERGKSRDKEFHMQVNVADKSCSSWAHSKKLAKRNAAEKMLAFLGYSNNLNQTRTKTLERITASSPVITNTNDGDMGS